MVPAVTVDDLVAEAGARSVSLVKIDVHGAEMLVLEGAKRTVDKMRPALFVEVYDPGLRYFGSSARAFVAHIERAGYEMHESVNDGPPRKLSHDRLFAYLRTRSYIDVLFLPHQTDSWWRGSQSGSIRTPDKPAQSRCRPSGARLR